MKIALVPFCGLGNRLNVISSAVALKKRMPQYDITVYWHNTPDCRCDFSDLFLPIDQLPVVPLKKFYLIRRGKQFLRLPMLLRLFKFDKCFKARKIWNDDFLLQPDLPYTRIYIEGNKRFCPVEETQMLSRYYRLTPELEQRVEAVTRQFADFTIGVHIRRTDHRAVIRENPLDGFLRLMREQQDAHPGCRFYIASDDEEVKNQLRDAFPGLIVTQPSVVLRRDDVQGMKDAVVELFTLARTQLIIGSKGSTYSDLASKLYDTPLLFTHQD